MSDDSKPTGNWAPDGDFSPPGDVARDRVTSGFDDRIFSRAGEVERDYFTKGAPQKDEQPNKP